MKNRKFLSVPFTIMTILAYQSTAVALDFGTTLTVVGVGCSIAGAAISAYQLSQCKNNLPTNLANSTLSFNGNKFNFNLGFLGGDFDSDNLNQVISGSFGEGVKGVDNSFAVTKPYWNWQIVLSENAGFINDVLSINGFYTTCFGRSSSRS